MAAFGDAAFLFTLAQVLFCETLSAHLALALALASAAQRAPPPLAFGLPFALPLVEWRAMPAYCKVYAAKSADCGAAIALSLQHR